MKEMVNHPDHYNAPGRKECIEEMVDIFGQEAVTMWAIMTAYKYRYRLGAKDDEAQERGKIQWYEDYALKHPCDDYRTIKAIRDYEETVNGR